MGGRTGLEIVPGAMHYLFEEPRALEFVAQRSRDGFATLFAPPA